MMHFAMHFQRSDDQVSPPRLPLSALLFAPLFDVDGVDEPAEENDPIPILRPVYGESAPLTPFPWISSI